MSWYNEIDPAKAEWLRQLMAHRVIEQGTVDERSITEIKPHELEADICHFFAGIGIWQYALQLAGWTGPVWTGSCPCTPFSVAGQRKGQADERHLWPAWFRLITERRPVTIFGEQVSDGDGQAWLDNVQFDLESVGYRIGSLTLPAASVGAPHGRHRTFFVADTKVVRSRERQQDNWGSSERSAAEQRSKPKRSIDNGIMADAELRAAERQRFTMGKASAGEQRETHQRQRIRADSRNGGDTGSVADTAISRHKRPFRESEREARHEARLRVPDARINAGELGNAYEARSQGRELRGTVGIGNGGNGQTPGTRGAVNDFWADAEWIPCRGKIPGTTDWRAIKPRTLALADGTYADLLPLCDYGFPLVKGTEARSLRLRGYGDGIVVQVAVEFIKAYMSLK